MPDSIELRCKIIDPATKKDAGCGGPLGVRGGEVFCESCGRVQENHPLLTQGVAAPKVPDWREPEPVETPASLEARVRKLEQAVLALQQGTTPAAVSSGKRKAG